MKASTRLSLLVWRLGSERLSLLALPYGNGLLKKITSVQTSGDNIIINTTQATLTEAIEKGEINLKQSSQKLQIEKVNYYYNGIKYNLQKGDNSNYQFDLDVILYDADGDTNTTNDQIKLLGNFILTSDVVFDILINSFNVESTKIGLGATNNANLRLIAGFNYSLQNEIKLATIHLIPIYYLINSITSITLFRCTSISTTSITNFPMGKSTKFS